MLAIAQFAAVWPLTAVLPEPAAGAEHLTRHLGPAQKYRARCWSRRCCPTRGSRDRVNPLLLAAVESTAQPWAQPVSRPGPTIHERRCVQEKSGLSSAPHDSLGMESPRRREIKRIGRIENVLRPIADWI
jgi:hypothetical protein